jgi:hypothetical protein
MLQDVPVQRNYMHVLFPFRVICPPIVFLVISKSVRTGSLRRKYVLFDHFKPSGRPTGLQHLQLLDLKLEVQFIKTVKLIMQSLVYYVITSVPQHVDSRIALFLSSLWNSDSDSFTPGDHYS